MMNNNQSGAGKPQQQSERYKGPKAQRRGTEGQGTNQYRRSNKKLRKYRGMTEKFQGSTEELRGYYYDMGYNRTEQYNKTTKAICNYVGNKYKNGADVRVSIEAMEILDIPIDDIQDGPTPLQRRIWEKEVDDLVKRRSILDQNLKSLFSLIWGQCSVPMKEKVETLPGYDTMKRDSNSLSLLQGVKDIVYDIVTQNKYRPQVMHETMRRFFLFKQEKIYEQ